MVSLPPPAIRVFPMAREDPEIDAYSDARAVQQEFFLEKLPTRTPAGRFHYRTRGLQTEPGTLVLFQFESEIIASAIFVKQVRQSIKEGSIVYNGSLYFSVSSIQVFKPIPWETIRSIWKNVGAPSHVMQKLDPAKYLEFVEKLEDVRHAGDSTLPNSDLPDEGPTKIKHGIAEHELRGFQLKFEGERIAQQKDYSELEQVRREFVRKFPLHRVATLTLDEYVEGHGNQDSFCYWVEWKTSELGRIQGSTAIKFGVYFNSSTKRYKFTSRFKDEHDALASMRHSIFRLIEAGRVSDLPTIRSINVSPMFKGKILALYYPDQFLNVLSEDHVDHFIKEIGILAPNHKADVIDKREWLLRFKDEDAVMSKWTANEYMHFLYYTWRPHPKISQLSSPLRSYLEETQFPEAEKTNASFVSLEFGRITNSPNTEKKHKSGLVDFVQQTHQNKRIGDQGEEVVYWTERKWLEANGKHDLAERIEKVYRSNPGAGYDIKSFELDETPKYIEVKSTTDPTLLGKDLFQFYLTYREYEVAQRLPNFYLYIVFDVKSLFPKVWRIRDLAKLIPTALKLKTSIFRATLAISSKAPVEIPNHG
jgi:hypothetical protein